jgi:hypothetical protein
MGQAFLEAHPRSPHANRVRSLVGLPDTAPPAPVETSRPSVTAAPAHSAQPAPDPTTP